MATEARAQCAAPPLSAHQEANRLPSDLGVERIREFPERAVSHSEAEIVQAPEMGG